MNFKQYHSFGYVFEGNDISTIQIVLPISYVSAVVLTVLRMLVMMSLRRPEYTGIYSSDKRDFIIQIFIAGWPAALESGCCSDVKP